MKVAGAWVHAAELLKPAASRPNSKKKKKSTNPKEKGGGNRPPKGQNDPLKTYNRYGSLEEDAGISAYILIRKYIFPDVMTDIIQWNVRGLRANFEELKTIT